MAGSQLSNQENKKTEREQRLRQAQAYYEALRADPEAWAEYQEEQMLWAQTDGDGLPPDKCDSTEQSDDE